MAAGNLVSDQLDLRVLKIKRYAHVASLMKSSKIKGVIFLSTGVVAVFVTGFELISILNHEPAEITSFRFGTLRGLTAILFMVINTVIGAAFAVWGVYLIMLHRVSDIRNS